MDDYFLLEPQNYTFRFRKSWQTVVQTGLDGTEQRSSITTWPRRAIDAEYLAENHTQLNYLKRILFKSLHLTWGLPFWQDKTTLTAQASNGQRNLDVESTSYRNFEVGAPCILFESITSYEVGTIDSFTANQITLVSDLTATWPTGTRVYPLLQSKLMAQQEIDLIDPSRGDIIMSAYEEFDDDITRSVPSIADFPTYLNVPVFNFRPRHRRLKQILHRPYFYLGFLGKSYSFTHYDETSLPLEGEYFVDGRDTIQQCLDFFDYHRGRWGIFWIPTYQKDIVIKNAFNSTDIVLTVHPIDFPTYWDGTNTPLHIAFRFSDNNALLCRKIVSADATTITLDNSLGVGSNNPEQIVVSFLLIGRFDMDEIEMRYITIDKASATLRFYSLPSIVIPAFASPDPAEHATSSTFSILTMPFMNAGNAQTVTSPLLS